LAHALFAVFFPDECHLCRRVLRGYTRAPVCGDCLDSLEPVAAESACPRCGQALSAAGVQNCRHCSERTPPFDAAASFGLYQGDLRRLIHLLKYERMLPLAHPLAAKMTPVLARFGPLDSIVPVPLHWHRRWTRGFNQSALLAKNLAARCDLALEPKLLRRVRKTSVQAGLSDQERRTNLRGAFTAGHAGSLAGRRLLLVDDVMTTGATLAAAADALRRAGASYVGVLTLARADRYARTG
jgi:ComF family protein